MAHSRGEARLLKRAEIEHPAQAHPWPPDPSPERVSPPERTTFRIPDRPTKITLDGTTRVRMPDAAAMVGVPDALAEHLLRHHRVPGAIRYRSGFTLVDPLELKKAVSSCGLLVRKWGAGAEVYRPTVAEGVVA